MAEYVYPAVFEPNELGGYCVSFPDLENVFTHGEDLPDALKMAQDALCLMLYDLEKKGLVAPEASNSKTIVVNSDSIVSLVACNTEFYRKYFESKSVKINVTLPLWLKEEGEKRRINFSQVLQDGVKEYLQIQ